MTLVVFLLSFIYLLIS